MIPKGVGIDLQTTEIKRPDVASKVISVVQGLSKSINKQSQINLTGKNYTSD